MELQLVQNEQFKVRKTEHNGQTWFVGRDVAEILGYTNNRKAILDHVEDDDRFVAELSTEYGLRKAMVINEIGVYSLVLGSKLPEAKLFKRWICQEVIPSIRKTGAYMTAETLAQVQDNPAALQQLAAKLEEQRLKLQEVRQLVSQHEQSIKQKDELIERKNAYFVRNKPRIDFAKAVFDNQTAILVGEMAKLLAQNGIEIGQNRFFEWLREHGFLQSKQGEMWNVPYQRCIERGLFIIKENVTTDNRGKELITRTPMITGKGQRYFISKFLETKDQEALAALNEEELHLASNDMKTEVNTEVNTNAAAEPAGSTGVAVELEGIDGAAELEPIGGNIEELEGVENAGNENNENLESITAAAAGVKPSQAYLELEAIA